MKKNILVIIVTFKPDKELLKRNIDSIIDDVEHIIVWENTDSLYSPNYRVIKDERVEYVGEGRNKGISYALNYAWKYAVDNNYDYLLTMDQDSVWDNFRSFKKAVFSSDYYKSAIFCPSQDNGTIDIKVEIVDRCITSGALFPISILNTIGGFCNTFYVDMIDSEVCYRAKRFGYPILKMYNCRLKQRYGIQSKCRFLFFKFYTRNYSPNRLYGIIRNSIILLRLYPEAKGVKKIYRKMYLRQFFLHILFGEANKKNKIKAMVQGWIDGHVYNRNLKGFNKKGYIFKSNDKF